MAGGVGMTALAVEFPSRRLARGYWEERYPAMIASERDRGLSKVWSADDAKALLFDREAAPYMSDPFRGAQARRVCGPGESCKTLELKVARQALSAARLSAEDVDLLIVCSFLPDSVAVGDAPWLARQLELGGEAFNLESACAGSMVAFTTACNLVRAGGYRNVLVVVSCVYSRLVEETDTLFWSIGDGAAAFTVSAAPEGVGLLGWKSVHTGETAGAMAVDPVSVPGGEPVLRMRPGKTPGKILRETAEPILRTCVEGALRRSGKRLEEIDFVVTTTPTAWYSAFCSQALGYPLEKTINLFPMICNVGPVLVPANLHAAAAGGRVRAGDTVLLYAIGSESSASAAVVKWGEVALAGAAPG